MQARSQRSSRHWPTDIRTLSAGSPRAYPHTNRNRPHREAIHDWRDRQQRRTFRNDGQDSEFGGSAMMPEAQVGDCDG